MSVRMALTKLCAVAAGGAVIGGGAVHVAEGANARTSYSKQRTMYAKHAPKRVIHRTAARTGKVRRIVTKTTTTCATSEVAPEPLAVQPDCDDSRETYTSP